MSQGPSLSKIAVKDVIQMPTEALVDKNIIVDRIKIENRFKNINTELNNKMDEIVFKKPSMVNIAEFQQLKLDLFSDNESIEVLDERLQNIDKYFKQIRDKELDQNFSTDEEIIVDLEMSKKFPELSSFLKNHLLKDISQRYFQRKLVGMNEKIVDQMEYDKKHVSFLYFSTKPVETLKLSKMNEIVNNQGHIYKIKEIHQSNDLFKVVYQNESKSYKVRIPVFYGILVCGEK